MAQPALAEEVPLLQRMLAPWRAGLVGLDRRVRVVVLASVLTVASRMGVAAFQGIYFTQVIGLDIRLVGVAFLAESLARGLVAPLAGALSDRAGRRVVMLVSVASTALVLPLFLLVRDAPTLLGWSLLMGTVQGALWPSAAALLIDLTPPARRQTVLSLNYTAIALGYTVGVLPAGFLVAWGYGTLATVATAGYVLTAVLLAFGLRSLPKPLAPAVRGSLVRDLQVAPRDRAFMGLVSLALVFPLGIGLIVHTLAVYAAEVGLSAPAIGFVLAVNGPVLVLFALPVNARIEGTGPYRFLPFSAAVLALSYLLIAWQPTLAVLAFATVVFTIGELIFSAALPTAVSQLAPEGSRGAYQGAWAFVFSVASGSALFLSGVMQRAWGWRGTWVAWALFTIAVALALLLSRPRFRRIADARARQA